MDTLD